MFIFVFNTCKNESQFPEHIFYGPPLIRGIAFFFAVLRYTPLFWSAGLFIMNGYQLTRHWYNFKFENPDMVRHIHSDMYFYIVDLWNRLGQKQKIGLPTSVTMDALGIGSRSTYYKALKELIEWGFIEEIQASKNQNQSRVISISACSGNEQTGGQALDQAIVQAGEQTTEHIIEQENKRTKEDLKGESGDSPPSSLKSPSTPTVKTFEDNYKAFITHFNHLKGLETGTEGKFQGDEKSKRQFKVLYKQHSSTDIVKAINAMFRDQHHIDNGFKYATPEFITRQDKFARFLESSNS